MFKYLVAFFSKEASVRRQLEKARYELAEAKEFYSDSEKLLAACVLEVIRLQEELDKYTK